MRACAILIKEDKVVGVDLESDWLLFVQSTD